jgi:hypothetical protein
MTAMVVSCGNWMTNSIRPFLRHAHREVISPAGHAQKLSAEINVELVIGQEVCGQ